MEITPEIFAVLFTSGLLAGFIDSVAGGGGLITLPVLLSVGLPPQLALGTNKLQGSFGTLSASYNYIKKGEVKLKDCHIGILYTFIGAAAGSWAVQMLNPLFIKHVIPFLLLFVLFYTLFSPKLGDDDHEPRMKQNMFFLVFGMGLGFYDGFFGPGTGSFWTAVLCIFLGFNMTKASGITRVMNFTSNIVALSLFIIGNNVLYSVGIIMAIGQVIGARIGSNLAIQKGARFIRPVFLTVVLITIVRLVYLNYLQ
ncbi:MAG: TSUP family transporter [Desulfobacterales bacterium]|nr:TSUP family transporter [Desulfobacterales bacterium]